ncbi:type II toxin-antitoxin system RelE/ParE family toxin [Patescibacteria group bacterium]|nr:type II toxin-antitoxin system RelE/ParE family toxin [Patescibacteria group bacterium]
MVYEILFTNSARRELVKLDAVVKKTIKIKLLQLQENPLKYAKKLHNNDLGGYRWRVGSYRVIFDLEKSMIIVLKIAHRRDVYK